MMSCYRARFLGVVSRNPPTDAALHSQHALLRPHGSRSVVQSNCSVRKNHTFLKMKNFETGTYIRVPIVFEVKFE